MYIISKGECTVDVHDGEYFYDINDPPVLPTLSQGDIFGEISTVYGCKRTATIRSRNFLNLAKLPYKKYKQTLLEFPFMREVIKEHIFKYKDHQKFFMQKCLNKVPYLQDISLDAQHDLLYNMVARNFFQDEILIERGADATCMYILQLG